MDRMDNVQGPQGSKGPNQNEPIGLGPIAVPCPWAPEGVATPVVNNII